MIKALIAALALTLASWSAPALARIVEDASVIQPQLEIQYQLADVYVRGYTRKDGTYVRPHYRSSPDNSYNNNWSVRPNINPYTGQRGTKSPTWNDRPPSSGSNTNPYGTLNLYDTPNPYGTNQFKW